MAKGVIPTETMTLTEARAQFSEVVNRVYRGEGRVLVEKSGIPVAVIVSVADLEALKRLDAERARRFAAMEEISRRFADVPLDELERQVAKAVAEARAELRAERETAANR